MADPIDAAKRIKDLFYEAEIWVLEGSAIVELDATRAELRLTDAELYMTDRYRALRDGIDALPAPLMAEASRLACEQPREFEKALRQVFDRFDARSDDSTTAEFVGRLVDELRPAEATAS
jgi:hypothetical protein